MPQVRKTKTTSLGRALLVLLISAPVLAAACEGNDARQFAGSAGSAGSAGTAGQGAGGNEGDAGQGQGATSTTAGSGGTKPTAGSGPGAAGSDEGGAPSVDDFACVKGELTAQATGMTNGEGHDFSPSCGSGTSPDVAHHFVAPAAGYYSFDSQGSTFDTVLAVFESCGGKELGCNQDLGASPQSEVVVELAKDQEVVVVVDGNVGDQGSYSLNVEPVTCPGLDLTGQPFPVNLSTVGQQDNVQPTCHDLALSANSPERTLRWVPEEDGLYRFSVTTAVFRPTLSVHEGAKCGGKLLQCNYNVVSGHPAQVTRRLKAGEPITLVVDAIDGKAGAFTLDMAKLPDACPALPPLTANKTGVTLNDTTGTQLLSSSCTWAGNQSGGNNQHFEEHIYPITIPATGFTNCTYSFGNIDNIFVAYLLRGNDCGGEEVACTDELDDFDLASFSFSTDDAGDYLLVIENTFPFGGSLNYDITKTCY